MVSGVTVDFRTREVFAAGQSIPFTTREFELLAYFIQNRRVALSRRQLLDGVWGPDWYGDDRTVDVHVRQLRKKLGNSFPLVTVWGIGYRMD
jgi:DNA-binding response OmpR family regulator